MRVFGSCQSTTACPLYDQHDIMGVVVYAEGHLDQA